MIPVKLTLSGFLSYRQPVEIDFSSFDLACISGPNGAGKSSLLDGITWALFGQARKRDDAIINLQSEAAEVVFTFDYEGNRYRVARLKPRDKTTVLEFHIRAGEDNWKPLTERTMRATEARLQEILRLDYDTFVNASFFLQGKADQFTQQRPGDRKRILSSILGLEVWESYRKTAFEERRAVENTIAELDGRLQEINIELAEEERRNTRLKDLQARLETINLSVLAQKTVVEEMRKRAVSIQEQTKLTGTLAGQVERSRQALEALGTRRDERMHEKQTYAELIAQSKTIEVTFKKWNQSRADLEKWDATATQFNQHEKRRHNPLTEIETARTRLDAEGDSLRLQRTALEETTLNREEINTQMKTLGADVETLNVSLEGRAKLEEERQAVIQRQADAKAENPRLKAEMDDLKARIDQLKGTDGAACPTCGQPLSPEERQKLIEELTEEGTEMGDKFRANQALLKEVDQGVKLVENQMAAFAQSDQDLREKTRLYDQMTAQLDSLAAQQTAWEEDAAPRLKAIEIQLKKEDYAHEARKTLAEIDAELKVIGYDAEAHDRIRKQEQTLRAAGDQFRALEKAQATLKPLEREIKDLDTQVQKEGESFAQFEQQHLEAVAALAVAQSEAPDVGEAERRMLELQEEENQVRMEVGAAQQEVDVLATQKIRKAELENERETQAQRVAQFKLLERAFGRDGVPAMLIEQALPQIENKANEVLERLSSGTMNVRFITQTAYKDKSRQDLRETLEIQISDNAGIRDYEMFSGGEAFRINFAIRLALSEVLAKRAGARLQTLVIDEGFGSQDEVGRQRLVEAINLVKEDFAKILVITHIESLKEAFPARLEVTKTPRGSVVEVV